MLIPSRRQVDAFCGSPTTLYQRIVAILAPAILLGTLVYLLVIWNSLPVRIPMNYNMTGEITGYGGRATLLIMPIIGLVMDLSIALVERFPKSWNTGVRVTVLNRVRVYRLVRTLMADLRLACAVMFSGFAVYQSTLPEHFSGNVTGLMILLTLAPLVAYFIRLRRAR